MQSLEWRSVSSLLQSNPETLEARKYSISRTSLVPHYAFAAVQRPGNDVLVFIKFYVPETENLIYCGKVFLQLDSRIQVGSVDCEAAAGACLFTNFNSRLECYLCFHPLLSILRLCSVLCLVTFIEIATD